MDGLIVTNLHTGYRKKKIIDGLTTPLLPRGKITALLGPNGSGKSTLLRAMADLNPAQGKLELNGEDLMTLPSAQRAQKVVYLPQSLPAGVHLHALESVIVARRASGSPVDSNAGEEAFAILEKLGVLNREGLPIILVEQKAPLALKLANRAYVMSVGRIAAEIDPRTVTSHDDLARYYLG